MLFVLFIRPFLKSRKGLRLALDARLPASLFMDINIVIFSNDTIRSHHSIFVHLRIPSRCRYVLYLDKSIN